MTPLSIAFVPLTDAAVLVAAKERGFAERHGIDLLLVRNTSWATTRDRLIYGQVHGAHMLAPLAVAVSLGLGPRPMALAAPFKLGVNGIAVTLAPDMALALDPVLVNRIHDPEATANDLAAAIGMHRRKPIFGVVHRYSSHALMLRYWIATAGIHPDRDLDLRVLPPSLMVEAMQAGELDGFVAGEPWNSVAVARGVGEIVATGAQIWRRGVEKVLALREDWAEQNPDTVDRLVRALDEAAAWCDQPANREALAELLSRPEYIGQPAEVIERAISGQIVLKQGEAPHALEDFLLFHREATNFPWRSQGLWIYSQFVRWGLATASPAAEADARRVFRSDIYRRALAGGSTPMPTASMKLEGALALPADVGASRGRLTLGPDRFFDGRVFDPDHIGDYLAGFKP